MSDQVVIKYLIMTNLTIFIEGVCSTVVNVNMNKLSQLKEKFSKASLYKLERFFTLSFETRCLGFFFHEED